MGFRNPITTLSALDTGAASGHSSVYIDPTNELVGFRGFFGGDGDSTIQRQRMTAPAGERLRVDTGYVSQGTDQPSIAGPTMDYEVAGTAVPWKRTLRLSNVDVVDLSGAPIGAVGGYVNWTALAPTNSWIANSDGCWYKVTAGWCTVTLSVAKAGWPAGDPILTVPAAIAPAKALHVVGIYTGTTYEVDMATTGVVAVAKAGVAGSFGVVVSFAYPLGT